MREHADFAVGDRLPALHKHSTTRQLVQYAGAVEDFNEHHYDLEFVRALGLPDLLVHGSLQAAWLAELADRYIGGTGWVVRFDAKYVRMAHPGDYVCHGEVTASDRDHLELDLWGEDDKGARCTEARATVQIFGSSDERPAVGDSTPPRHGPAQTRPGDLG